jgi:hypothetical protein
MNYDIYNRVQKWTRIQQKKKITVRKLMIVTKKPSAIVELNYNWH